MESGTLFANLLTEDNEWVRNRPRWVAELPGGVYVYMDDGRDASQIQSAWSRLAAYVKAEGVPIIGMRVQYGPTVQWLPGGQSGYFFCRMALGFAGVVGADATFDGFVAGYVKNGRLLVSKYLLPTMQVMSEESREIDTTSPCLILNQPIVLC
jgi:hypothetical protein